MLTWKSKCTKVFGELFKLLLGLSVFLCHLLVFCFPLIASLLEGLHLAFEMAGLDIGLTEPAVVSASNAHKGTKHINQET